MAFQPQIYTFNTMAAAASQTSALSLNGCYLYMYLVVPTMAAGYSASSTPLYIQGSADGVTFARFTNAEATNNTLVAGINDFQIASSVSSRIILIPNFSLPYMKVEISGTATSVATQFKLIGVSNQ